jgi:hypothetical protein
METSTLISLTGSFLKLVGDVLADVKRRDLATIGADLLKLKRDLLSEKLEEFKSSLAATVTQEKGKAEQDLISRGLGNTTVRQSTLRAIEHDAATELEKASREYNRAIEEIALIERRLVVSDTGERLRPEHRDHLEAGIKDIKEALPDADEPGKPGGTAEVASTTRAALKRSTERGEGKAKLIAALTKHHKYANGSCPNREPIGNNVLAKAAGVSPSTASAFFMKEFGGHTTYRGALSRDVGSVLAVLAMLNGEIPGRRLLGRSASKLAAPEQEDTEAE